METDVSRLTHTIRSAHALKRLQKELPDPHSNCGELTGMSRSAWFSAFGLPFFLPSVLSLAELPDSKHRGTWLGTVCPLLAMGIPAV